MNLRTWGAPLLSATLLFCPGVALAAAAQVLFSLNRVVIERGGQTMPAPRGTVVEVGDTFSTGLTGYAQLRFKDGALLVLKPGSSINIEEFSLPQPALATAPSAATVARISQSDPSLSSLGGRSVLRLLRGAFRTITGSIGKGAEDVYRVVTPTSTIGIRGTDYSVAICSGGCGSQRDGLYVGVSDGKIILNNAVGEVVLNNNEYAYVRDNSTPPEQQLAPPEALETTISAETAEGSEEEKSEEPGSTADASSSDNSSPPPESSDSAGAGDNVAIEKQDPEAPFELQPVLGRRSLAFATGPAQAAVSSFTDENDSIVLGVSGDLVKFAAPTTPVPEVDVYDLGTSQNLSQVGFDPDTGLRWGRWSGGMATVNGQPLNLAGQSLHWIYGPQEASAPVLPVEGTLSYTLVGNTDPTNNLGNVGFVGSAHFSACFSCANAQSGLGTVQSTLDIGIGGQVWNASGSGGITADTALFTGVYSSVSVDTVQVGSGDFAGFFTNNAASAGLSYNLVNGSTTVSGAAAFGNPSVVTPQ